MHLQEMEFEACAILEPQATLPTKRTYTGSLVILMHATAEHPFSCKRLLAHIAIRRGLVVRVANRLITICRPNHRKNEKRT